MVPIPSFTKTVWLDECCASGPSYERLGRFDHEWNADIDILEQVCWLTPHYYKNELIALGTSTTLPEPS